MSSEFPKFAKLVTDNFQKIAKSGRVFVSGVTGDALYDVYIKSFPEGTNPLVVKKTEHECSTCKSFIRRVGNVVGVGESGLLLTIWDAATVKAPAPYDAVARELRDMVMANPITDLFRVSKNEASFGAAKTRSQDKVTKVVETWDHFYTGEIPNNLRVVESTKVCGEFRTTVQVFERGLIELSTDAIDIGIEDFVNKVLPTAKGIEIMFKNEHVGNLMALTAPVHPEPKQLFRWDNDFAWAYGGNVTDSIKERVKRAGGKVDGAAWPRSPSMVSQTKWGLTTETFAKVNTVTLSPNYWGDNAVGNKHTFFVLEGCKSDESLRGIFNEFLHPRLEPHRKVFEVIGDKTKCQPTDGHLAGLGFSSTKKDSFIARVLIDRHTVIYNVKVG